MKPFNNRFLVEPIDENKISNDVFKSLEKSQKYKIVKYIDHSSNNKTIEQDIYEIVSKIKSNQEIFMVVENHMIEEIEFDNKKYFFVPIPGIICFTHKPKVKKNDNS